MSMKPAFQRRMRTCFSFSLAILMAGAESAHADSPGLEALDAFRNPSSEQRAVENRYFLKSGRFEISPTFGYVPNNTFVQRISGSMTLGYHFSERFSAQGRFTYAPDLGEGDVKSIVPVLLDRAAQGAIDGQASDFRQPIDKVLLATEFGVAWSPFYGKINLVGETVLNFDFYGFGGVGMVSKQDFFATYDPSGIATGDILALEDGPTEVRVGPALGVGGNFFVSRAVAVKLDLRGTFYIDNEPQYQPGVETGSRVYNNLIASAGVAFFLPQSKARFVDY